MSYPTFVLVTINEVDGVACGPIQVRFKMISGSDPPEYRNEVTSEIPFGSLRQIEQSAGTNWELFVFIAGTSCAGGSVFRRDPLGDDPTGSFCAVTAGATVCEDGQATVVNDD